MPRRRSSAMPECWHSPKVSFPRFDAASRERTFALASACRDACGQQAPGGFPTSPRTRTSPRPRRLARRAARRLRLPHPSDGVVLSVMEFFSREIREPDQELLRMLTTVGTRSVSSSSASARRRSSTATSPYRSTCSASPLWTASSSASIRPRLEGHAGLRRRGDPQQALRALSPSRRPRRLDHGRQGPGARRGHHPLRESLPLQGRHLPLAMWTAASQPSATPCTPRRATSPSARRRKQCSRAMRTNWRRRASASRRTRRARRSSSRSWAWLLARRGRGRSQGEFLANMSHGSHALERHPAHDRSDPAHAPPRGRAARIPLLGQVLVDALLALVNDILDFSKIEARRLDLERCPSICARASRTRRACSPSAPRKSGSSWRATSRPTRLPGWWDPGRLRQVLVDLLGNAIKFTDRARSCCAWRWKTWREGVVLHSVSDTGVGIAAHSSARSSTPSCRPTPPRRASTAARAWGLRSPHAWSN